MGSITFVFITFGFSLYVICAQNSFSQPSNTLDTNQDGPADQSMKGLTFFEDNPLFNDSFRYLNPSGEKANSLPGWQSMIPHFIPHHMKIAHILMNRNQQTDINSRGILGDIPELPPQEGIFAGGDPTIVMSNATSNIPVVSFRNAFERNVAMPDNQVPGNGQQFFRGSQNDTAATSSIFGLSSIQRDSSAISGEINTSFNTIDTNNHNPSMQLVGSFNDHRGKPLMRAVAEFVDISDAVEMRPIGEFQDRSNQDSKSVINKDAIDIFWTPASNRSTKANDVTDKPDILVDIVFPTLRPPVRDANLRPIDRPSINSGEVFSRTNGVSGMNINEQSSSSKTNTGGIPVSPELTGAINFNQPDGQVFEFGGATVQNAPATNNLRQTVSSNIISVPARSSQTQDMNVQQITFPKQLAPVIDDSRVGRLNVNNAINADGSFGSIVTRVDIQKLSGGQGMDFGINAISVVGDETNKRLEGVLANTDVNSGKRNLNGFSDSTLVTNENRPADNVNGINQDTIGRNGQLMTENQLPFSGKFEANMPNDQQSNTGMISARGQNVQGNQFRNDLTDRMQNGNKIAGGKDSTVTSSLQNNMQPINDNIGPPNLDIRVRQTTSNGNTNMPNGNGEQNMQGNVNPLTSNRVVTGNQQVAPNQDNERVITGVIDQGSQPIGTNGQPVGENVGSIIRNGRLFMSNSQQPVSGNNIISGPNTLNNQFVGQTGPVTQPVMNGQSSNLNERQVLEMQQSINSNSGTAGQDDLTMSANIRGVGGGSVIIGPDRSLVGSNNAQSPWVSQSGISNGITRALGQGNNQNQVLVNPLNGNVVFNAQLPQNVNIERQFQNMSINGISTGSAQSIGPNGNIGNNILSANTGQSQPPQPMINGQMMNMANVPMFLNSQNTNPAIQSQGTRFNQPMTDNQIMNNQAMTNQNMKSIQPINMQRMNLNQQMNNPGVNGMNSQVTGTQGNAMFSQRNSPGVNGMNIPGVNGMNNQGLNGMNSQVTGGMNNPGINGMNSPGLNGMNSHATSAQGNTMFNQMNNQGVNGMNSPDVNGMNNPGVNGINHQVVGPQGNAMFNQMNSPGVNGVNSQGANGMNSPGTNGMNSQVTGPQGNTMFNQMNSQGVNGMNSPGVNGMNNPGVNGMNNPGVNGMNSPSVNGMNNPGVNGMNSPRVNGMNNPGVNGMNSPSVNGMNNPGVNGMNSPGVNGMNSPSVNGMNNPGVNGMNNPGVNGMNSPGVNGMNSPSVNGMNNPGVNGMINPGVNGINNPGVNGMNNPVVNGMNNPGVNGVNTPSVNGMNSPSVNGVNNPSVNGMNNPGVNGMNSQVTGPQGNTIFNQMNSRGVNGMNNPGVNGMNNPGVNGMNNPGVNGMNSQVTGPQGTAMLNQMTSQGMMQLPNGPGAQMNNMGTIQPSNGQVQVSGQQNNPWMMQGNFQNPMNGIPHSPNNPFTINSNGGFQGSTNMNLIPQQNNNRIRNFDGSFGQPMQQQPQQQNPFINMGQSMPMPFTG